MPLTPNASLDETSDNSLRWCSHRRHWTDPAGGKKIAANLLIFPLFGMHISLSDNVLMAGEWRDTP